MENYKNKAGNILNKLTALMLTITLCISAFCAVECRAEASSDEKTEENIKLMMALGFFTSDRFDEFDSERYMTRLEFSGALGKMFKFEEKTDEQVFSDVPLGTENAGYIGAAYDLEIFSGDGDGCFRPYDYITYSEVKKSILYAAGYNKKVDEAGAQNLRRYAESDLTKDLAYADSQKMRHSDIANVFENALDMCVLYSESIVYSDGKAYEEMKKDKDKTVLTYFLKIKKVEGIVTGNEYTSVYNNLGAPCGSGQIQINGENYSYSGGDDLIGEYVTAYISDNKADDKKVFYITSYGNNKTLSLSYDEFSYKDGSLYNEEGEKPKKIALADGAAIIYNENYAGSFGTKDITADTFDIKSGRIFLIDNNTDGTYEVCRITEYETVFINGIDLRNETVTDAYKLLPVKLGSSEKTEYYYKGREVTKDKLSDNTVLTMMKSPDGRLLRVYIADNFINGSISGKRTDNDGSYVTIGNKEYKVSDYYSKLENSGNQIIKKLNVGVTGQFILSYDGEIAAYVSMTNESYGYVIGISSDRGAFSNKARIKLFTENGRAEDFDLAEKTSITQNGETKTYDLDKAIEFISPYKVIKYRLNDERKISKVEISVYNEEASDKIFTQNVSKQTLQAQGNVLGAKYSVDTYTIVFNVPDPSVCDMSKVFDEQNYTIGTSFSGGSNYTVDIYDTNEYQAAGIIINYIGAKGRTPGGGFLTPMVVSGISETLLNDDLCLQITGYVGGVVKTTYISDKDQGDCEATGNWGVWNISGFKASDLKIGDVIQYTSKNNGYVDQYRVLFRPNEQKEPFELYSEGTTVPANIQRADMYTAFGKVLAADNTQVVYSLASGGRKVMQFGSNINTYVIDMKKETIEVGKKTDIHTGDDVFILLNYGGHFQTMIYRWE